MKYFYKTNRRKLLISKEVAEALKKKGICVISESEYEDEVSKEAENNTANKQNKRGRKSNK